MLKKQIEVIYLHQEDLIPQSREKAIDAITLMDVTDQYLMLDAPLVIYNSDDGQYKVLKSIL